MNLYFCFHGERSSSIVPDLRHRIEGWILCTQDGLQAIVATLRAPSRHSSCRRWPRSYSPRWRSQRGASALYSSREVFTR